MVAGYVELHVKSFYSFGMGASHVHELLTRAGEFGYPALAFTDTNLCGALEFARLTNSLGIRPVTGGELVLTDGSRIVLLAKRRQGYGNISRLFTLVVSHLGKRCSQLQDMSGPAAGSGAGGEPTEPARVVDVKQLAHSGLSWTWSGVRLSMHTAKPSQQIQDNLYLCRSTSLGYEMGYILYILSEYVLRSGMNSQYIDYF